VKINLTNPFVSIIVFLIYVVTSCSGLYLIKAADNWKTPSFLIGFTLYGIGALMWMGILRLFPLSFAFPIAAGSLVIGTTITGVFLLHETVSIWHLSGAFLIIFGITLIASKL
jgi:multidrug transporter EmrE-like cation transporter